jgi:NitT/TauT family transport system ATP-binding protein
VQAGVTAGSTAVALDGATVAFRLADARIYTAVEQVRLSVEHGEFVAIVGPTGCGKSTLLNVAAGLLRPSSGTVRIFDSPLAGLNREAGYLFQADALFPWKTAIDNVAIGLEVSGVPLDAQTRQIMGNLLLQLWTADRKAVLFVTHDLEEAIALADRVVIMSAGPGARIIGDWRVPLSRPRDISEVRMEEDFHALHREIWSVLKDEVMKGYAQSSQAPVEAA